MPQHFHRLFSVLKIELKIYLCLLNYHLMSLNVKKILENIFWKFYMWKISILKIFPVFRPLFRRRLQRRGIIFLTFFLNILIDYFLQISEVVLGQKYFLNRPWSQKNLKSSWGGRWCRGSPFSILYMFFALWLGPTLASMSLLFTPYSPQPIK